MDSPARRVLGNKTTNNIIRTQSPFKSTKRSAPDQHAIRAGEPPVPSNWSKKRSIDEVEDAEREDARADNSQGSTGTQPLSFLSDPPSEDEGSIMTGEKPSHTSNMTGVSFGQSQQDTNVLETTFELMDDEMSQNTRDSLNAVPLPQNASQPQGLRPLVAHNLSQLSAGMSSFVDFDLSQQDELKLIAVAEEPKQEASPADAGDDGRRGQIETHAENCRARLKLAYFKVSTNQTTTPFARLRTQTRSKSPQAVYEQMSSSPPSSPANPERPSPETRIAIMRARAAMQPKKPVKSLDAVLMPDIRPTAFSARVNANPQLPSSPPQSRHVSIDGMNETPRAAPSKSTSDYKNPHTPMQLSSPPQSPEKSVRTATKKLRHDQRLTSSVIKGDAANALLHMKQTD